MDQSLKKISNIYQNFITFLEVSAVHITYFLKHIWGILSVFAHKLSILLWIFWVLLVLIIILSPIFALKFDILGTVEQWSIIAGEDVNPSELLRNLGWLLITAIGLPLIIWRSMLAHRQTLNAIRQSDIAQQGQFADRYAKAAAMLSDENLPVREAAIFALQELAIADPEGHYFPVQDLLCSFMRDEGRKVLEAQEKSGKGVSEPPPCQSDVIAALRALSDLRTYDNMKREEERNWRPDLQRINLAYFPGHSRSINLQRADLRQAQLKVSYLENSQLQEAILTDNKIYDTSLNSANLERANLFKAVLSNSDLSKAILNQANLEFTKLYNIILLEAVLYQVNLEASELRNTNFEGADLENANLMYIFREKTSFQATNLSGAKFSIPVWPEKEWPQGYKPYYSTVDTETESEVLSDEYQYFTFIPIDDNEEDSEIPPTKNGPKNS